MKESFIFLLAILGVLLGYQGIKRNEYILVLNKDDTSLLPPYLQLHITYQAIESTLKSSSHFGEHALESSSKLRDYLLESNNPSENHSSNNTASENHSSINNPPNIYPTFPTISPTKKYIWKNNTSTIHFK